MSAGPPAANGTWMSFPDNKPDTYTQYTADITAGAYYPSYLWSALMAAHERQLPGAAAAYQTLVATVSNLASWRGGFGSDPRWGSVSRRI